MEEFDRLKEVIQQVEDDVLKAEGGNQAAGRRVRKAMQDVKNHAQAVRQKVLELRGSEGESD